MSTVLEREVEVYGYLEDLNELSKADSFIQQEQWGVYISNPDGNSGNIRVRSINGGNEYILTTKVKDGINGNLETEQPTTKDMFNAFKRLATDGLNKTRYLFKTSNEDIVFEVDVFLRNGKYSNWVKIDIELPGEGDLNHWLDQLPELPITLTDIRVIAPGKKRPADEEFVKKLFSSEFTTTDKTA